MRLLYCYAKFCDANGDPRPLRGLDEIEVCLSATQTFHYDAENNALIVRDRQAPLPDNFWSNGAADTNVYNVNVIVGANGSGKTTAINYLTDLLNYIYHDFGASLNDNDRRFRFDPSHDRCILLFEDGGKRCLFDTRASASAPKGFSMLSRDKVTALLHHTKLIYMTNALNQRDYELHSGDKSRRLRDWFVYDCALGATMRPDVSTFFIYEVFKQVKFVFGSDTFASLDEIPEEIHIPAALKFRLLTDRFKEFFEAVSTETALPDRLGQLCLAASLDNIAPMMGFHPDADSRKLYWNGASQAQSLGKPAEFLDDMLYAFAVSGSTDRTLRIWDVSTGICLRTLKGHTDPVTCVALTEDGRCVSGSHYNTLRVWDLNTGECLRTLEGHTLPVYCVAVTGDGRCVSGSRDNTLRVWDLNTGECLRTLEGHTDRVRCVAVTADGRCVSGSRDKTLRVWDLDTGKCFRTLEGHADTVNCIAVTGDGRCVSGSVDHTLRVWDLNTGECLRTLKGHTASVECVAVTEDGRCVSGSWDGTLRVWDLQTGKCLRVLQWHDSPVMSVATFRNRKNADAVQAFKNSCKTYFRFLDANGDGLFSQFQPLDADTYELSTENVKNDPSLYDSLVEFMHLYMDICKPYYTIDFDWGLSSGEENMLRIFTWLHHLYTSDNAGRRAIRNNEGNGAGVECDSVLLFMDEADLTLHPEWQRRLIRVLMAFLPRIYPKSIARDIQLVLTTHSPLLLGDIPRENIVFLPEPGQDGTETFGQNIHTLLKDSFFLNNGTIGAFAAGKINGIAQRLSTSDDRPTEEELRKFRQVVNLVAPGILRNKLEAMLREAEGRTVDAENERLCRLIEQSNLAPEAKEALKQRLTSGGGGL